VLIDHLVYATPDLDLGIATIERLLGVRATAGGRHPGAGTRNALELATKQHARFTFFSSSEIYGDPDPIHVPTPESYRGSVSCRGPRSAGRHDRARRVGTFTHRRTRARRRNALSVSA